MKRKTCPVCGTKMLRSYVQSNTIDLKKWIKIGWYCPKCKVSYSSTNLPEIDIS